MRNILLPDDYTNSLTILLLWAVWFLWNGKRVDLCKWVNKDVISYYYIGLVAYVAYTFLNGFNGNVLDLVWNIGSNQIIGILYLGFVLYWLFNKKKDKKDIFYGTGYDDYTESSSSSNTNLSSISSYNTNNLIYYLFGNGEKLFYIALIFFIVYNMLHNNGLFTVVYDYIYSCITNMNPKVFMLVIFIIACVYSLKKKKEENTTDTFST